MEAGESGIQGQLGWMSPCLKETSTQKTEREKNTARIVQLHAICGCLPGSTVELSNCELVTYKGRTTVLIRLFLEEACLPCVQRSTGLEWDAAVLEPCLSLSWHQSSVLFFWGRRRRQPSAEGS